MQYTHDFSVDWDLEACEDLTDVIHVLNDVICDLAVMREAGIDLIYDDKNNQFRLVTDDPETAKHFNMKTKEEWDSIEQQALERRQDSETSTEGN
jgi:hypothetical protein